MATARLEFLLSGGCPGAEWAAGAVVGAVAGARAVALGALGAADLVVAALAVVGKSAGHFT